MKRIALLSTAILVLSLSASVTAGDSKGQVGFDKLKALLGEWESQTQDEALARPLIS